MHVMPHIKTGVLATRAGTIMAGALSFKVREWKGQRFAASLTVTERKALMFHPAVLD